MLIRMLDTRRSGATTYTAGTEYTVADDLGALMVGGGWAVRLDGTGESGIWSLAENGDATGPLRGPNGGDVSISQLRAGSFDVNPGFDFYVDSEAGDDAAAGTFAAPFATLAKAATVLTAGKKIGLKRGSKFRESLVSSLAFTLGAYGDTRKPLPLIDCTNVIQRYSWSKTAGRTLVYETTVSHSMGALLWFRVWENGQLLTFVNTIELCDSTPGSYFAAAVVSAGVAQKIYVNATGSTDPAVNDNLYEVTARDYAIDCANSTVQDIHTRRNGHPNGSLFAKYVYRCLASEGNKHNLWVVTGGECIDTVAYKAEAPGTGRWNSATMFVTFSSASASGAQYENCYAYALTSYDGLAGFYAHTSGGAESLALVEFLGCKVYNCTPAISTENTLRTVIRDGWIERVGIPFDASNELVIDNMTVLERSGDGAGPSTMTRLVNSRPASLSLTNSRVYTETGTSGGLIYRGRNGDVISGNMFYAGSTTGYKTLFESIATGGPSITDNVTYNFDRILELTNAAGAPQTMDRNVYFRSSGAVDFRSQNTNYASFAAYRTALPALDAGSVYSDPFFIGNVRNGEFHLESTTPANTGGRSAGKPRAASRPDWSRLVVAWDAGFLGIDGSGPTLAPL